MRYLNLFLIVLILLPAIVSGQSASWHYLPNNSFTKGTGDTASRIEDICFTDTLTGYAVTLTNKLYKTTDGGISWQLKNDTQKTVFFRSIDFLDDGMTGLAGALGAAAPGFMYTDDGGNSWTDIANTITDTSKKNPTNICGLAHWGNTFYGVGSWGSKTAKFYKSTDKGKTWTTKYIDQSLATGLVDVVFISQDTGFVTGTHDHTMSVILKTTDGGDTWQRVFKDTVLGGLIWKIQFVNKSIAVGSIENVFLRDSVNMVRSNDGGNTWSIIAVGNMKGKNNFSGGTQAVGFATPLKGWVGGYYNGIFQTNDGGLTWNHLPFGYDFNRIFVIDSTHVFAGGNMPYKYGTGIYPNSIKPLLSSQPPHTLDPITPNPAKDLITIRFDLKNATNLSLKVISIDGRQVYDIANAFLQAGPHTYRWDATGVKAGNYILWMGTNEIQYRQQFIVK